MTKEEFSIISAENHSVKGIRWISAIYKSLLFVIFLGIMGTQVYAADALLDGAFIARLAGFGLMIIGLLPLIGVFAIWILTRRLNKKS